MSWVDVCVDVNVNVGAVTDAPVGCRAIVMRGSDSAEAVPLFVGLIIRSIDRSGMRLPAACCLLPAATGSMQARHHGRNTIPRSAGNQAAAGKPNPTVCLDEMTPQVG